MGEPGGLPSMGSHRVGHDWSDLAAVAAACRSIQFLVKIKNVFYFYLKSNDFFGQPNKSADRLWTLVTPNYSQSKGLDWNGQGLCPFPVKEFTFTGPPMIYKSKIWKKTCKNVIKKIEKKKTSHKSHHPETSFLKILMYDLYVCIWLCIGIYFNKICIILSALSFSQDISTIKNHFLQYVQ